MWYRHRSLRIRLRSSGDWCTARRPPPRPAGQVPRRRRGRPVCPLTAVRTPFPAFGPGRVGRGPGQPGRRHAGRHRGQGSLTRLGGAGSAGLDATSSVDPGLIGTPVGFGWLGRVSWLGHRQPGHRFRLGEYQLRIGQQFRGHRLAPGFGFGSGSGSSGTSGSGAGRSSGSGAGSGGTSGAGPAGRVVPAPARLGRGRHRGLRRLWRLRLGSGGSAGSGGSGSTGGSGSSGSSGPRAARVRAAAPASPCWWSRPAWACNGAFALVPHWP